ncbi:MAG: efflux RND transporter permease subunit, partial [Candidatus Omnitrophota bacterium]
MIEFFVKRPVTTIMFVSVFVVLGIVSIFNLRVEEIPKIDFPIVTITATYPGATPWEVETLVINKIEDAVSELAGIRQLRSESYDNFGYVFIEFNLSEDVNVKFIEAKDKVEAILNDLPDDIEKPIIEKYDPLMQPVMDLVLLSDTVDGRDLYEFADKKLKDQFSSVNGVASVEVYGGKERRINVILDPMLMKRHYVTISDVIESIKAKNMNVPGGLLEKGDNSLSLRFLGEFEDPQGIADMIIVSRDGAHFPLKEIARVEDSFKKVETVSHFNGKEAVGLSIIKVSDGNAIDISREIRRRLGEFRSLLPEGVSLEVATDTTKFIIDETNDTYLNIIIGIALTVVILYLFTGQIGLTFIAAIAIPTSIVSSLLLVDASGFTINMMTLLAMATVLGTLIANAIVIVENVLVHLDKGDNPVDAAINGTKEVTAAIFASAGTNLVVFMPIASMGGMIGQFFKAFGMTVVYATLFSILASFSLTPMLCGILLKKDKAQKKGLTLNPFRWMVNLTDKIMVFLRSEYEKIFKVIFRFPKTTVLLVLVLLFSMKFILPYIDNNFMPVWDEDMITVKIELPQGSTIDRTLKVTRIVEERVEQIPELESYLTSIGNGGVENSAVVVNLVPSKARKRSDADIIEELIPFMSRIPDTEISLERGEARGGVEGDISINVYGQDYQKIIELSRMMKQEMEKSGYFRSVKSSYKVPRKEIRLIPDQKRLIEHGVSNISVGSTIRAAVYGDDTNIYKEGGEEYDINVELDKRYTEDLDDLKQIDIISRQGMVPVVELGDLKEEKAMPQIRHRDKVRVIRLEGYLSKSATGYARGVLDESFKALPFEQGYGYKYVEMAEREAESVAEIGKAFLIAVVLTYMLLCAIMNSFFYPVPIIFSVATSFIGIFLALFFMEESMNIASMLGMVMIVGLVVNNSILLLDYAMLKMEAGVPVI